jgi:hypothetical protein
MRVESNWGNPDGIPGLTEAVEKRDWKEAHRQAGILAEALARNAAVVRETAGRPERPPQAENLPH